jgi:hypothetical protein
MQSAVWLTLLLAFTACSKPTATSREPAATCTKVNDRCTFSDGKIGLCTPSSLECDGAQECLVCMNLH